MRYSGLELIMEKLNELIYHNDNPFINKHPSILSERYQIQNLYEELDSMIQTIFVEKESSLHEEEVKNLIKRFKDVAEEAQGMIDLFVFGINQGDNSTLNLEEVMRSIKSIKVELKTMNLDSAVTSSTRNSPGKRRVSEDIVVGLDHDANIIRGELAGDRKQLDVVSIVGMGGLGKTTLASKVFNDRFIVYHFHIRAWVTISQTYDKRDLLIQVLASIGILGDTVETSYSRLRALLYKTLMGKRYLIVVDDIWSIEAWNELKLVFPDNHNRSRILLTSRIKEVALHAKAYGYVHQLEYLTDEESWELLRMKVFQGNNCPEFLIKLGKEIAKDCHGLPLAVVVIAGVLANEELTEDSWERIAQSVRSFIVNDAGGYVQTLALSYDHLPLHLRDCFLYLGGFPEDHKFQVRSLIWLWMAEGFIQNTKNRNLEEIGEDYLMELVDRNLVLVADRRFDRSIKACSVHDLLRELCLAKATEEDFCLKIDSPMSSFTSTRPRRIFTDVSSFENNFSEQCTTRVQSLLCYHSGRSMINISNRYFFSYPLLMVLDLQKCRLKDFPQAIELLVHLRYLAFWYTQTFPSSICNLWSLQTLIVRCSMPLSLPIDIVKLVNLKNLWSDRNIFFPTIENPMKLQTISKVALNNREESWVTYFPCIKKLTSMTGENDNHDFEPLISLETLTWIVVGLYLTVSREQVNPNGEFRRIHMRLPPSLRKLTLAGCCLPWSDMSILQSLPLLEVLKILENAFLGPVWETGGEPFALLKFLKLQDLNIQQWEASSRNFPQLRHLVVERCENLEEIPPGLGDIPMLELIDVDDSSSSVVHSLDRIREDQNDLGNDQLQTNVKEALPSGSSY